MTQDQYGQARGSGHVVRGDAVPDDETEDYPDEQGKSMTRFQKVASALRGDRAADRDEGTEQDRAAMAGAGDQQREYWDEPVAAQAERDEAVAVTRPDAQTTAPAAHQGRASGQAGPDAMDHATGQARPDAMDGPDAMDHTATDPDMFGSTERPSEGAAPYAEGQPGAATIADVPAAGEAAGTGGRHAAARSADAPAADAPARGAQPDGTAARGAEPDGTAARGAQPDGTAAKGAEPDGTAAPGTQPTGEMRPGEATGALGDFSDLTYGNLVPDAQQYATQWEQIQFRFVDDPQASVTEAADIVAQVTAKMEAAIQERQRAIEERQRAIAEQQRSLHDRWGDGTNADTEALRETLRMYKTFLDQLIGGSRAG